MRIIPRDEWGARYPTRYSAPLPATRLYLHHSVTIAPDLLPPFDDDDAAIRTLEQIGRNRFGSNYGISYTFAITPVGRIYDGHGVDRQGAHTKGLNTTGRAICWVGNYDTANPTTAMIDATVWLVRHGFEQGWWDQPRLDGGHRDAPGASTACPGRHAYALIGDINVRASRPATLEDDMAAVPQDQWDRVYRELTDRLPRRIGGSTYRDTAFGYALNADSFGYRANEALARVEATQRAILTAVAAGAGVDPAALLDAVREATASAVVDTVVPALRTVVAEVLGQDDETTADAIVDALSARLAVR